MKYFEQLLSDDLELLDNELHVYLFQFSVTNSSDCLEHLSEAEHQRADKLKLKEKRDQFIITRHMLRELLSRVTDKAASEIIFNYGEHGKPSALVTVNDEPIKFNLSHSGDYGIIAIGLEHEIGIDIEQINQQISYSSLSKRFFSQQENNDLVQLDEQQQCDTFYKVWARKESFIKATGKGVSYGLDNFSVPLEEGQRDGMQIITSDAAEQQWFCYNVLNLDGYKTALTIANKNVKIVIHR